MFNVSIGALLAIWIVAYHSLDPSMKDFAFKNFLLNVDYQSFEKQAEILEVLKIIPEANSEHEDSDAEDYNKVSEILSTYFYRKNI